MGEEYKETRRSGVRGRLILTIQRNEKASSSFLAMFLGWLVAYALVAVIQYFGGNLWFSDKKFWSFMPAAFVAISWLIIVLPVLTNRFALKALTDLRVSWLSGTILALASYMLLVFWWTPVYFLLLFPAVVGLVAGITFPVILNGRSKWYFDFSIPVIVVLTWSFIFWPLSMKYMTNVVYQFGSFGEQMEMMDYIVPQIQKGMTLEELNNLLPMEIEESNMIMFNSTMSYDDKITLENGVVTAIELTKIK